MEVSQNKSLFYKIAINLSFWFSFGIVILVANWAKVDFVLAQKPVFPELENLIETKQFILLIMSGFTLYGLLCFAFRKLNTTEELGRARYFQNLALQEWSSVFFNFGSVVAVTGFLTENYWYAIGTLISYIVGFWIARE
ncbi:TPA: hypothetical protein N2755_001353 [Vibrio parahaemolyticus]|uniref:hypothetical protein n=1 Tax=Vibrio sp. 05-20-BW147 TaxID=2575834 RepID=UPI001593D41E|nr:hypothetical protein [Vibrio sp. 05-20-BW147]MDF4981053.1 hypothetical protein [Vibrio parahaemolyticus]NVC64999.1 hypothetical protein [Vibrio sp. 05-20-BW147]HAS6641438.1 hypothetical protein [Vibrio parahaemolyticus]HCE2388799.1 hypothetical protein [Vibrio parahaemolyticus]HCH0823132.1 hypothetical protein [Vibrio parahaemolyticus]